MQPGDRLAGADTVALRAPRWLVRLDRSQGGVTARGSRRCPRPRTGPAVSAPSLASIWKRAAVVSIVQPSTLNAVGHLAAAGEMW